MCTAKFQINWKHQEKRPLFVHLNLSKSKHEIQHGMKILNEGHSKTTRQKTSKTWEFIVNSFIFFKTSAQLLCISDIGKF